MRVVSSLLKSLVYPCLAGAGYFRSRKGTGVAVITYHGLVPPDFQRIDPGLDGSLVSAENFRRQLRLLKSNYNVISPEDMLSWCWKEQELPPRAVLITCDDGLQNNVGQMLPILQEEGLRCLFFVTGVSAGDSREVLWYQELLWLLLRAPFGKFQLATGESHISAVLGSPDDRRKLCGRMIRQLSRIDADGRERFLREARECFRITDADVLRRSFGLMTRTDLQALVDSGMAIGAHTLTHPILAEQPRELAWIEIVRSRTLLESVLGRSIWALAYPFGQSASVSSETISMAEEAGFTAAFMNFNGGLGAELPKFAIPRVHVTADMDLAEFEAHVSGFCAQLHRGVF